MIQKITSFALTILQLICAVIAYPRYYGDAPVPANLSDYNEPHTLTASGDYYVSPNGSDDADGSFANPFKTIEKARDIIRTLDKNGRDGITVCLMSGEYRVDSLVFNETDSGTAECPIKYCAYGDCKAVINSGFNLKASDFSPVSDAMATRLKESVRSHVVKVDLTACGLSANEIGKIHAIGSYNIAGNYGESGPMYSELFFNDQRMTLARYPDSGSFVKTGEVVYNSREENGASSDWSGFQSPAGDIFTMDKETAAHVAAWATLDNVWAMGYWKYDWADGSTPLASVQGNRLETKYASFYGVKEEAPYYFFNVFEELDSPGEYYIDRDTGTLYFYPDGDIGDGGINLTVSLNTVIVSTADYLTFEGLTIQGTRADGIRIEANHNTVRYCTVKNIGGNAIIAKGYDNLVSECDIYHTGRGGITLDGGNRDTLTPGNSKADNNHIHDWSEVYLTYQPGVTLAGVGNICSHNEFENSPHEAITYYGNNHLIEYNDIHNVVLQSDDAGAIYAGRNWSYYGIVIRYNCLYDIGSGSHTPSGIYMDDALSGQTIYGNLIIDVPGNGIQIGGGRDMIVKNNIVIGSGVNLNYDSRAIDAVLDENAWFHHSREGDDLWQSIVNSPWQSDTWKAAYPQLAKVSIDYDNTDDPYFCANPALSDVSDNIFIDRALVPSVGKIDDFVTKYSTLEHNAVVNYGTLRWIMPGYLGGDYTVNTDSVFLNELTDAFTQLPISEMGRY